MDYHCQTEFYHSPRDLNSHYFGCLNAASRPLFLSQLPPPNQAQLREEDIRITQLRSLLESQLHTEEAAVLLRHKQSLQQWRKSSNSTSAKTAARGPPARGEVSSGEMSAGDGEVSANMMFFKDSRPHTLPDFLPEEFPEQKIPLKRLLYDADPGRNPLTRGLSEGMLRYFHVPVNDMKWVEELMSCYYDEDLPFETIEHDWVHDSETSGTKTRILLNQEVWRGQQRGTSINDPVHSRSMRPSSYLIPTPSKIDKDVRAKNLVLYMPYLHWETYQARMKQARTIKSCDRGKRSTSRKFSDIAQLKSNDLTSKTSPMKKARHKWHFNYSKHQTREHTMKNGQFSLEPKHLLGQVLLRAAKLAISMNFYTDRILLQHRLDLIPPLHPRRTLNEYYYWTLKDIENQDKGQVVYRATAPTKHLPDQFAKRDLECRECLQDIRKVPRLLMVDQLWLWILDANTVITFFPSRWGRKDDDRSDVHTRLRMRLKTLHQQEIHSAYDLAVIIIDQCSQVFFDRSAIRSLRPQVLESFAHAIGDVSFKQITSLNHFLEYTRLFSLAYKTRHEKRSVLRHQSTIDISVEVKLLQEIKDILDELMIMTNVLREQQAVSKTFVRHLQSISRAEIESEVINMGKARRWRIKASSKVRMKSAIARAAELGKGIHERIAELQRLSDTAAGVASGLNDLLGLKQQQMGVVEARLEAREAVEQGRETVRQGRTIMLFTVVTIVFMPLSFVASVFGMNVAELNSGNLSIRQEFSYMFPICLGFSLVTLAIAFKIYTMP